MTLLGLVPWDWDLEQGSQYYSKRCHLAPSFLGHLIRRLAPQPLTSGLVPPMQPDHGLRTGWAWGTRGTPRLPGPSDN